MRRFAASSVIAIAASAAMVRAEPQPRVDATNTSASRTAAKPTFVRSIEPAIVVAGRAPRAARVIDSIVPANRAAAFANLAAAGWHARWDRDTEVPAWLWGRVDAPGAIDDAALAERDARAFLAAHIDVLAPGATASDFVLVTNRVLDGTRDVAFVQTWRGSRIVGASVGFVFRADRLFAVRSSAIPIVTAARDLAAPRNANQLARASSWLHDDGATIAVRDKHERVLLPIVHGRGDIDVRVVDVLEASATPTGGTNATRRWDVFVAPDGTPIARASTVADASATLTYNAGDRYASGARSFVAAVQAHLTANGVAKTTAVDGTFSWTTGPTPATVVPSCHGSTVDVQPATGTDATTSIPAPDGATIGWSAANVEVDDAQISTFVYGNVAIERARVINPAIAAWLAGPIVFRVNEANPCNAFSDGTIVHLAKATPTCEDTGRVADIVYHEFGHSLHFQSIIAGMGAFDLDMSEGLADFNAANITDDPGIGRGLDFTDAAVRDIDPPMHEAHYPEDMNSDPHISGLIISGALWDLRKVVGSAVTEKIFTGIMQRADGIPTTYDAALVADDDDADLSNGTPHFCAIFNAFGPHGLATGYEPTVVSSPIVDRLAISVPVSTPTGQPCPPRQVTGMRVLWKVGDSIANELDLAPGDTAWTGTFPEQPDGTVLSYSVDVNFDDGSHQTFPDNPADPMYQTFVGAPAIITCETFDHEPLWTSVGTFDDWQWGALGTAAWHSGDPTAPHTGMKVFGENIMGAGNYDPDLVSAIEMPEIVTSSYQIVHLQYWRWLTVQDATRDQAQIFVNDQPIWENSGAVDHVDREWRFHDVELTAFIDGAARVRWAMTTDALGNYGGWTLDDVCLVGMNKIPRCGDDIVDIGEECDDGNMFSGDGCSDTCKDEIEAGGGGCACRAGGGDLASPLLGLGVIALLRRRRVRFSSFTFLQR